MRTAKPENIKSDFLAGLLDIETVLTNVESASLPRADKNLISEYSFLGASVLLEGYISDLFVTYINKDSSSFVSALTGKMSIESGDETAKRAIALTTLDISTHLTLEKIRDVLDPKGWNVTFSTVADMKQKAGVWLAAPYKERFTLLSRRHSALVSATKAMRNYLAHRSRAAHDTMQTALAHSDLTTGFKRGGNKVHSIGSFLESVPAGKSKTRLAFYISELRDIANHLYP